jgi:hypothetical protein
MVRRELSVIDSAIHERSPVILRLSHIQVLPQLLTMSQNTLSSVITCGLGVCNITVYTPKLTCFTVQYSPFSSKGTPICGCIQQLGHLV